jgi:hypothetical protein
MNIHAGLLNCFEALVSVLGVGHAPQLRGDQNTVAKALFESHYCFSFTSLDYCLEKEKKNIINTMSPLECTIVGRWPLGD